MAPEPSVLFELAADYLARQDWFRSATAESSPAPMALVRAEILAGGPPGLGRLVIGRGDKAFGIFVGWRAAPDFAAVLRHARRALLGMTEDESAQLVVYDALVDPELAKQILTIVTNGTEQTERVRLVSSLVSHASLVFDERLLMKAYRVLEPGTRPEVEMFYALDNEGFNAMLAPVGTWHDDGYDLALVREFLPSALEGRLLALTSLRDLLAQVPRGDEELRQVGESDVAADSDAATALAGGDFASEMLRLGEMTARLHLALERAFGSFPIDLSTIVDRVGRAASDPRDEAGVQLLRPDPFIEDPTDAIRGLDPSAIGHAIRIHGDYHLRRVLRAETGWLVGGFSDDPLYGLPAPAAGAPARTGSPLEDLADMSFALGQVAREAVQALPRGEEWRARGLAQAWKRRNRSAFLRGYLGVDGSDELVPVDGRTRELLLSGFEMIREHHYRAMSPAAD